MASYLVDVSSLLGSPGSRSEVDAELEVHELVLRTQTAIMLAKPRVVGVIEGVGAAVRLRAELTAVIEQQCGRCLETFATEVLIPLDELYVKKPAPEPFPIAEGKIDLIPAAVQALLMEVPLKPLCDSLCAGLCPVCGKNLNLEPHECKKETIDDRMSGLTGLREVLEEERKRKSSS